MNTARTRRTRPVQALAGILLAASLALTGCSGGANDSSATSDSGAVAKGAAPGALEDQAGSDSRAGGKGSGAQASTAPQTATGPHIIRTVSVSVQVKNVPKALAKVRATAENAGGFVGSEMTTLDEEEGGESTDVVLRVPVGEYERVLDALEGTGKLLHREAEAKDVTDQVVDVESRITTQRASVNRIRELMDRATKLSDVVTLEGELSRRQADLESLLARQASLKDRTSLATINLSLSENPAKESDEDDDPGVLDALAGGWSAFVSMLRWIVVALAAVLPFAAVAALLVFAWLRLTRARRQRPAPATATGPAPATSLPTAPPAQPDGPDRH
ncbi:DUF4349 domain-containing protein [Streptomyces sp. WI04-05B]|uniref:DUF4349 domain-containing protein n=1 Tax=Streptomyces TaxID=1883 RepID=UPI0029B63853|nr:MULTISPECIES: DUF4349 domain-containing protein [unclassified Streptomyces]MDX2546568.1 DUF4349 domain-containing protein [Streptomyces sp. WI04-05B]MDX2587800.1 DUF4349 domain-containing protein [Streptomyces sp. WI04-05A]MDX3751602.1 DUF4349 domain-containing protein [Streptomyces sp. AK08-02]